MWGCEDSISAADDAFLAIIGYSRADLENGAIDWRAMTPPEYLHRDDAGNRYAVETGGFTMPYQKEFVRKDGTRVPVLLVCAFIPGKPGQWMGYVVDLTLQSMPPSSARSGAPAAPIEPVPEEFHRRLVGELVTERMSLIALLDSCDSPIWAVDANVRLILANSAFQRAQRRLSGRRMEPGESVLSNAFPEELLATWRALYSRALRGERVTHFTATPVGAVTHHHDHVLMPMRDASGRIYGVTCVAHNVAERLAAEDALRHSESRFRTLASASPLGIFLCDATGHVVYTNQRMQQIWQLDADELLGTGSTVRLHPDDLEQVFREWAAALGASREVQIAFRLRMPDDSIRNVRCWISPLIENGRSNGFVGSVEDATTSVALAQRTKQRERMESLGTLAGGIAHDFNNMLGIVLGYVELGLTDPSLPRALTNDLLEIRTASLRARDLVRQILTFSRHTESDHVPVDVCALARESGRLLRATLPAHIAFAVRVPQRPATVRGNASALQQVIVNLCVNAEHALRTTEDPAITLDLRLDLDSHPETVRLIIRDNGHGMPSLVADRIFEPFFTTKQVGEGTGMGLAVVHGTILAHGGTVTVDTAPGRGTTFVITLPTCGAPSPAEPLRDVPVRAVSARGSSGVVLLVEDEPQLAIAMGTALRRAGFQVTICHTGQDALRMIADGAVSPDVVVSDVAMPGLAGDRLARELELRNPSLPVVLMTGHSATVTPDGPRGPNVIAVLQKPVSAAALATVLEHVMS